MFPLFLANITSINVLINTFWYVGVKNGLFSVLNSDINYQLNNIYCLILYVFRELTCILG